MSAIAALLYRRTTAFTCRAGCKDVEARKTRMAAPVRNYERRIAVGYTPRVLKSVLFFKEFTMTAIPQEHVSKSTPRLHLAFELGWSQWKLAFTIGHGQPARLRTITARDLATLLAEIAKAKRRFGLPDDAEVVSCYEAGRDGFWLHRWLTSQGVVNL